MGIFEPSYEDFQGLNWIFHEKQTIISLKKMPIYLVNFDLCFAA